MGRFQLGPAPQYKPFYPFPFKSWYVCLQLSVTSSRRKNNPKQCYTFWLFVVTGSFFNVFPSSEETSFNHLLWSVFQSSQYTGERSRFFLFIRETRTDKSHFHYLCTPVATKDFFWELAISAANNGESKLFRFKNVWEVLQILFLATIVNAFLLDIKTNLCF